MQISKIYTKISGSAFIFILAALLGAAMLSSCGQKGPLKLPAEKAATPVKSENTKDAK